MKKYKLVLSLTLTKLISLTLLQGFLFLLKNLWLLNFMKQFIYLAGRFQKIILLMNGLGVLVF